jgi:hypothetical protein
MVFRMALILSKRSALVVSLSNHEGRNHVEPIVYRMNFDRSALRARGATREFT